MKPSVLTPATSKLDDDLLTPREAADMLRTSPATLSNLRYNGGGPTFLKLGRSVLYRRSEIDDYLNTNSFTRTDTRAAK